VFGKIAKNMKIGTESVNVICFLFYQCFTYKPNDKSNRLPPKLANKKLITIIK